MMKESILCNNANATNDGIESDSIESELINFAKNAGYDTKLIRKENLEKLELPFDSHRASERERILCLCQRCF